MHMSGQKKRRCTNVKERFLADPSKVRVTVRFMTLMGYYVCEIISLETLETAIGEHEDPQVAVTLALHDAEELGMPGIDLSLEHVYDHPQKPG